jgi:hypothetical protein
LQPIREVYARQSRNGHPYLIDRGQRGRRFQFAGAAICEAHTAGVPIQSLTKHQFKFAAPWQESDSTIVLALSAKCPYCVASIPFYRTLDGFVHRPLGKSKWSLTVISADPVESIRGFLDAQSITADHVFVTQLGALGLTATPSLLVIDSHGTVRAAFAGKLQPSEEESLMKMLREGA